MNIAHYGLFALFMLAWVVGTCAAGLDMQERTVVKIWRMSITQMTFIGVGFLVAVGTQFRGLP